jgi:hypothetical protein
MITNRTVFYIWQPGNVWLDHLYIRTEGDAETLMGIIQVDRAVNLTKERQQQPTQLFLTNTSIVGEDKEAKGLEVVHGSVFVDSAALSTSRAQARLPVCR